MAEWQGVAMDSLKFHPGPLCPTLLCLAGWPLPRACPQGGQPATFFYPFEHPTPYAYAPTSLKISDICALRIQHQIGAYCRIYRRNETKPEFMRQRLLNWYFYVIQSVSTVGEFHDQADAKWIVSRGPLRGHNDTPLR
jgi:hypothetical protein